MPASFEEWRCKQNVNEAEKNLHKAWMNLAEVKKKEYARKIGLDPAMPPKKHRRIVASGQRMIAQRNQQKVPQPPRIPVPNNNNNSLANPAIHRQQIYRKSIPSLVQKAPVAQTVDCHQQNIRQRATTFPVPQKASVPRYVIHQTAPTALRICQTGIVHKRQATEADEEESRKRRAIEIMANSVNKKAKLSHPSTSATPHKWPNCIKHRLQKQCPKLDLAQCIPKGGHQFGQNEEADKTGETSG